MAWKLRNSREHLRNRWITLEEHDYELPDGKTLPSYWIVRKPAYVLVVAESDAGLVLIREWRPGSGRDHVGFPAGFIDAGEDAIEAGQREFREETGYELEQPRLLGVLDAQAGWLETKCHVVAGRAVPCHPPLRVDSEIEAVLTVRREEVRRMIRDGEISEMHAVAGFYLALD